MQRMRTEFKAMARPSPNIDALAADVHSTRERVDRIESVVESLAGKIDRLFNEMTRQQAQPRYEPGKILGIVLVCATLLGAAVSGIVFVSSAISSAQFATLQERNRLIEFRLNQIERIERASHKGKKS